MCSHDDDTLDFSRLEKELQGAVESENNYWRENDAKLRAVAQKVGSYEEFRDMVLAAHIRPLEKEDKVNRKLRHPWNTLATKERKVTDATAEMQQGCPKIPQNDQEFIRDWRRYYKSMHDQLHFLLWVGGERLRKIFRGEIGFGILGDIVRALLGYENESAVEVLCILENLSKTNRFALTLRFMNSEEMENCKLLLSKLYISMKCQSGSLLGRVEKLRVVYQVENNL